MQTLRSYFVFAFLIALKALAHLVYRFELEWLEGDEAQGRDDPWSGVRIAAGLHHTATWKRDAIDTAEADSSKSSGRS